MSSNLMATDLAEKSESERDVSTLLAAQRTRVAYERTMMAWIRTATSLITFGFTVYKFFDLQRDPSRADNHLIGPREFGMILVSIGLLSLVLATWENRAHMKALEAAYGSMPRSMATTMATLISLLGILAIIVMIFRA
jgi:inner membrane protein YidH